MLNFQNLQNLASLQQQQKLSFVGLAGLSSASTCLNSPLNLSLSSSSHTDPSQMNANCSTSIASELAKNLCGATAENYPPQMPQLILASVSLFVFCLCFPSYFAIYLYFKDFSDFLIHKSDRIVHFSKKGLKGLTSCNITHT